MLSGVRSPSYSWKLSPKLGRIKSNTLSTFKNAHFLKVIQLSCDPIIFSECIYTHHTFNQCWNWFDSSHPICATTFPPKNTFLNKESKKKKNLHFRVIISRLYKGSWNQASKPEVQRTPLQTVIDATIWRLHDRWDATNVIEEYKTDSTPADNVAPHNGRVCIWGCRTSGIAAIISVRRIICIRR